MSYPFERPVVYVSAMVFLIAWIFVMAFMPLSLWLLIPAVFLTAVVMQTQLFQGQKLERRFWVKVYLREGSWLSNFLQGRTQFMWMTTMLLSFIVAVLTIVYLYSYDWIDCAFVAGAMVSTLYLHAKLSKALRGNVSGLLLELAHIRVYYWLGIVLVVAAIGISSVVKGGADNYSELTSNDIAARAIADVKHPVEFVRHCARIFYYTDMQLLRIRDIVGWPYGWIIYAIFLIPNTLPAFGVVTMFLGISRTLGSIPEQAKEV